MSPGSPFSRFVLFLLLAGAHLQAAVGEVTARGPVSIEKPGEGTFKNYYYLEFLPPGYDDAANAQREYPLLITLHGAGKNSLSTIEQYLASPENDAIKRVKQDPDSLTFVVDGQEESFVVISPHTKAWGYPGYEVIGILEQVLQERRIDQTRIYLTGLSMGGKGTWSTAACEQNQAAGNYFAALAPMAANDTKSGWGEVVASFDIPVWSFHGENDNTDGNDNYAGLRPLREMLNAGRTPKVTIFSGTGHGGTWGKGYVETLPATPWPVLDTSERPNLQGTPIETMDTTVYEWLLQQRRSLQLPGYSDWLIANGLTGADADEGADPDADGLVNKLEYALMLDPQASTGLSSAMTLSEEGDAGAKQLIFEYRAWAGLPTGALQVEVSSNLVDWSQGDGVLEELSREDLGGGLERVRVRDRTTLATGQPRYLRLRMP